MRGDRTVSQVLTEDTTTSGLYHSTSQVLLARLYDNVLTEANIRKTCSNCGQLADTDTSDDNEEEAVEFSESDVSSTSTDMTVRLTRNYSQHDMNREVKQRLRSNNYNLGELENLFRNLILRAPIFNTQNPFQVFP